MVRPQCKLVEPPVFAGESDSLTPAPAGDLSGTLYAGSPCGSITACFVPRCSAGYVNSGQLVRRGRCDSPHLFEAGKPSFLLAPWLGSWMGTEALPSPGSVGNPFGVCGWMADGYRSIRSQGGVPLPVSASRR